MSCYFSISSTIISLGICTHIIQLLACFLYETDYLILYSSFIYFSIKKVVTVIPCKLWSWNRDIHYLLFFIILTKLCFTSSMHLMLAVEVLCNLQQNHMGLLPTLSVLHYLLFLTTQTWTWWNLHLRTFVLTGSLRWSTNFRLLYKWSLN